MLAGDPDEALDQAEQLLKERSLSSYYDEVALKGLQLAANDAAPRRAPAGQIERIKDAIAGLVHDLGDHETPSRRTGRGEGEPGRGAARREGAGEGAARRGAGAGRRTAARGLARRGADLCIAGRGPLDEAAATMLAQLLHKHGLGARVVPHEAVSRASIIGLDTKGVAMVCVSYLEITGNPAHLRYLLRRLRQKVPARRSWSACGRPRSR